MFQWLKNRKNQQKFHDGFQKNMSNVFERLIADSRWDLQDNVLFDVLALEYYGYCFAAGRITYFQDVEAINRFVLAKLTGLGAAKQYSEGLIEAAQQWLLSTPAPDSTYAQLVGIGHHLGLLSDTLQLIDTVYSNAESIRQALDKGDLTRNDFSEVFDVLRRHNVTIDPGLSDAEITELEGIYNIEFPEAWRQFFQTGLPIGRRFYNWRDKSPENIQYIRESLDTPYQGVLDAIEEIVWNESWGQEPKDMVSKRQALEAMMASAPKLIPIYGHRYLAVVDAPVLPVISVYGIDIIYYGFDLENYFLVEYGIKGQQEIDFKHIAEVPFWLDEFY
ncbi:MAG: hypothetical protein Q4B80_01350 [Aerococcaceae bacterium]|nr:hypothetical protein [Aerococcaceae bacterium]